MQGKPVRKGMVLNLSCKCSIASSDGKNHCWAKFRLNHSIDIVQEEQKASSTELSLEMELPVFAHAVIWQQAAPAPAPVLAPPGSVGLAPSERGGPALTLVPDPEVSASCNLGRKVNVHLQAKAFAGPALA